MSEHEMRDLALELLQGARDLCLEPPRGADPQQVIEESNAMLDAREPLLVQLDELFSVLPALPSEPAFRCLIKEVFDLGARWTGALETARHTMNQRRISIARVQRGRGGQYRR